VTFPLNVYLWAAISAAVVSWLSLPFIARFCVWVGLVDEPGPRKIHQRTMTLAGGLTVLIGILVPILAGAMAWKLSNSIQPILSSNDAGLLHYGFGKRKLELAAIFVGAIGMLGLGLLDDRKELRPLPKFGGQIFFALLVAAGGARITLFVPNLLFSYAITALWIVTVVNAFNFMDNMNGLCAGLGAIGAGFFALIAAADSQYLVGAIAACAFGSLLGFVPHNFPKARAFLGDAGSHLIGFLMAVLSILPHFYNVQHPRKRAVLIPLIVLAIPLVDLARVVVVRTAQGLPFYRGDTNHLSHLLVSKGFTQPQAVLLIWLAAVLIGALVLFC
jgi:UDP-GlcNAc:undecaprenyl-phosphate GlcNAc-1-phosphate transferase